MGQKVAYSVYGSVKNLHEVPLSKAIIRTARLESPDVYVDSVKSDDSGNFRISGL